MKKFAAIFSSFLLCAAFAVPACSATGADSFFSMIDDNNLPGIRASIKTGFALNEVYERNGMKGETPLLHAVRRGKPDIVKIFLDSGADVNFRSEISWPPLMMAVAVYTRNDDFFRRNKFTANDSMEIFNILTAHGADINAATTHSTPLLTALIGDSDERVFTMTEKLLGLGADANPKLERGSAPIFFAIESPGSNPNEKIKLVQLLLSYRANANVQLDGYTPLHVLASHNEEYHSFSEGYSEAAENEIAKLLLDSGADPNVRDASGRTPLDVALLNRNTGLCRLLISYIDARAH
ncbi:MAG: ankyrin repeat domain-containing protein [Synergistaceae bacterium]|nr:ankyrin repeat domain-containing protein [Synergistaceae bacterium]